MSWEFIDVILEANGLQPVEFDLLRPNESDYDLLLIQQCGDVEVGPERIGPIDSALAENKFTALFDMAGNSQPDLVFTPEYACPWHALELLLNTEIRPALGKLWMLGCESISPENLNAVIQRYPSVRWIVEPPPQEREQNFLTAVCFLFTARTQNNEDCTVFVLQFKQIPMADHIHEIESRYMIRGSERVIFRNNDQSIYLAVLICAEALNFDFDQHLPQPNVMPYVILHPQLNPDPRHRQFREYREYWGNRRMERMEILSLNWARGRPTTGSPISAQTSYRKNCMLLESNLVTLPCHL